MRHRPIRVSGITLSAVAALAFAVSAAGAATIVVNDSFDTLHGLGCAVSGTGTCTLRDAITFANAHSGSDEVHFAIAGSGVHTIMLDSDLPTISGALTIDGYTQSGSSPNTNGKGLGDNAVLAVEINGNAKKCLDGFGYTVRGLVINRCSGAGVRGATLIAGNFIGLDSTGTYAQPNGTGVLSDCGGVIGGPTPDARNVVSGNLGTGIANLSWSECGGTVTQGNFVGTDARGTVAVPNGGSGIEIAFLATIQDNLVSGNTGKGIELNDYDTAAVIQGNIIGADVSGSLPIGNGSTGVWIFNYADGSHSTITGNTIAYNGAGDPGGGGIFSGTSGHWSYSTNPTILGNSIFGNVGGGISVGSGGNTPCNLGEEGQEAQNSPALTTAFEDDSTIRIKGILNTRALDGPPTWRIEFFASPTCDGQGRTFLGSTDVTELCDAEFDVTLPPAVPVGQFITATATGLSTSVFSPCIPLQSAATESVVNGLVSLTSLTTRLGTITYWGSDDVLGTMTIHGTFKNTSSTPIAAPFFVVTTLTNGNFLANADGGVVGGRLTPNVGADQILAPGESFTTEFVVGLRDGDPFQFFVDLWGEANP